MISRHPLLRSRPSLTPPKNLHKRRTQYRTHKVRAIYTTYKKSTPSRSTYLSDVQTLETHMDFSMSTASQANGARKRFGLRGDLPTLALLPVCVSLPLPLPLPLPRPAASSPTPPVPSFPLGDRGHSIHSRSLASSLVTILALLHSPMCVMEQFIQEYLQRVASNESANQTEQQCVFPHRL